MKYMMLIHVCISALFTQAWLWCAMKKKYLAICGREETLRVGVIYLQSHEGIQNKM